MTTDNKNPLRRSLRANSQRNKKHEQPAGISLVYRDRQRSNGETLRDMLITVGYRKSNGGWARIQFTLGAEHALSPALIEHAECTAQAFRQAVELAHKGGNYLSDAELQMFRSKWRTCRLYEGRTTVDLGLIKLWAEFREKLAGKEGYPQRVIEN